MSYLGLKCEYEGYAPIELTSTRWVFVGSAFTNLDAITFPVCTGGSANVTHFVLGDGPPQPLTQPLVVTPGVAVRFSPFSLNIRYSI